MSDDIDYRKLVEAALFMSSKAVSLEELSEHTGIASVGTLQSLLEELMSGYSAGDFMVL